LADCGVSMSSEVIVTYVNIILYAISYQLQRPGEPFLVKSLIHTENGQSEETTNKTFGRLISFFSFIQTIGSPLVGILLDRIGPRRTSILVYLGSALSYAILSQATSPLWLYCSKIPTILQHAFLVGQATVSSSSESSSASGRATALGRMTTAYTIGATIGPALGGYLGSSGDFYAGARLAVWGSLISVVLSVLYLKDHQAKKEKSDQPAKETPQNSTTFIQSIQRTLSYLNHPTIGPLLFIKLLNGVSSSAFSTILPLILANKLHFLTIQLGSFMRTSVAAFAAICIKPLMSYVGNQPDKLAFTGIGCRLLSIVSFGLVVTHVMTAHEEEISNTWLIITTCSSITISLSSHMHATSLTTLTTGVVSREERGAIIGLEHGLFSMARIVGPPLGTSLISSRGPSLFSADADGLWRVIFTCIIMECVLMTCLKAWSSKQIQVTAETELTSDDNKPLIEEKDHGD